MLVEMQQGPGSGTGGYLGIFACSGERGQTASNPAILSSNFRPTPGHREYQDPQSQAAGCRPDTAAGSSD